MPFALGPQDATNRAATALEKAIAGDQAIEIIASKDFTFATGHTFTAFPAFCYGPLPNDDRDKKDGNAFQIGEHDTGGGAIAAIDGKGTITGDGVNAKVCFAPVTGLSLYLGPGVTYTGYLYHTDGDHD